MGLDVYVGPLSRYYAGSWETILQQQARETGLQVEVVRPRQPRESIMTRLLAVLTGRNRKADPETIVNAWMSQLSRCSPNGQEIRWVDTQDGDYVTDKPAWDCYGALVVWAANQEAGAAPALSTAEGWNKESAYVAAIANPGSAYRHLLGNTEIWLPADFDPPFSGPTPAGQKVVFGSGTRLLHELEHLNASTWKAGPSDIETWRMAGAEFGAPLEVSAKFGFAVFHSLARAAVDRCLPMKLDY